MANEVASADKFNRFCVVMWRVSSATFSAAFMGALWVYGAGTISLPVVAIVISFGSLLHLVAAIMRQTRALTETLERVRANSTAIPGRHPTS